MFIYKNKDYFYDNCPVCKGKGYVQIAIEPITTTTPETVMKSYLGDFVMQSCEACQKRGKVFNPHRQLL